MENESYSLLEVVLEADPDNKQYHVVEDIVRRSTLSCEDLGGYPLPEDLGEYLRVRAEIEKHAPDVAGGMFIELQKHDIRYLNMTTEQRINKHIEELNPKWTLVDRQDKESIWRREWVDEKNDLYKDYVVWVEYNTPPSWPSFTIEGRAFRFDTLSSALTFIITRNRFRLTVENEKLVTRVNIPEGRRIIRVEDGDSSNPFWKYLADKKGSPNCTIANKHLKSLREIQTNEILSI